MKAQGALAASRVRPGGLRPAARSHRAPAARRTPAAARTAAAAATATTAGDAASQLLSYRSVTALPDGGRIVITALQPDWLEPCADLLADSFIAAAGLPAYGRFVRVRIGAYLREHIDLPPKALVLTAVVEGQPGGGGGAERGSGGDSSGASTSSSGGGGGGAVLVGTAEVSFDRSTRSQYLTLNPPAGCAYICNCAVDPAWRRRGVAAALMRALEEAAVIAGERYAYLHLRFKDDAEAGALYRGLGYEECQRDGFWLVLLGMERRWLMRKELPPKAG
ncbi:hypothetical protein Rsub_08751 [Raphidocelis subcapitata]|uniref:N-acetyltransferase domain-containing protein n=1 Tax=Raphidocelis subcapitata TaxID=307507 RepID=A0A2V0P8N1_9CHLO|nr:hypothetical protein Rsub_08751 [Raphidocelis subcapitata]|eukprot:GBF96206.1 hypothetical protein Rsub_08751 [Raphidocelis subcapitata]